jgi:hypothetical protein
LDEHSDPEDELRKESETKYPIFLDELNHEGAKEAKKYETHVLKL